LIKLCAEIIEKLRSRNAWLATVESCTGGMILDELTHIPGASQVIWGGWVAYDTSAKEIQLGISPELMDSHGVVSREVAEAMAHAGLQRLVASKPDAGQLLCLSTTGVAGPTGSPVGLCWAAIATRDASGERIRSWELHAPQGLDRVGNKRFFTETVLRKAKEL